ncbi:MAG TPA: PIN domain-containing protein [Vicinamibacteria bacterium]|nr:PIN domain-containing protein [Vicinamibacteria bacterium]
MRVLVDTSVWVDFLNGQPTPEASALAELLAGDDDVCTCGVVVAEVFQGLRRDSTRAEIAALFEEMTFLDAAGIAPYLRAAELHRALRQKGRTVRSTVDCLVAMLAEANGCHVLARDRDLETILSSGLVEARLWRHPA